MDAVWYPSKLLNGSAKEPYAVLILNQPINRNALNVIVGNASLLVCADGGANQLHKSDESAERRVRMPDAIVGDLDSLRDDVRDFYEAQGVKIVEDEDKYSTDFTKSLKWIRHEWNKRASQQSQLDVVVLGGLGGRVDQGFSQIHHLYLSLQDTSLLNGRIYLLSESSLSFILHPGGNKIFIEPGTFKKNVGIIPVTGPCHITTTGLEWDVENWLTQFGGQISTSNWLKSETVTVHVDDTCPLFTLELTQSLSLTG